MATISKEKIQELITTLKKLIKKYPNDEALKHSLAQYQTMIIQ